MKNLKQKLSLLLIVGAFGAFSQNTQNDTTRINFNKTKILIISAKKNNADTLTITKTPKKRYHHWSGLELGINGLINSSGSFDLNNYNTTQNPEDLTHFMELDYRHSWQFNVNFAEFFIKIIKHNVGIQTGLGLQMNNYELKNNVRLTPYGRAFVSDTVTKFTKFYTYGYNDTLISYTKNRFKTLYLTAPLLLEFNTGQKAEKSFHFAVGGLFGYNIQSKMKYVYNQDSERQKNKDKSNFNVNPFQMSALVQVGYGKYQIFATYGFTSVFENYKGPKVYPVSVGIKLIGF